MIVLDAALKVFLWIAIIIVAILQVILFFKLWRMTDNVAGILRILERKFQEAPAEDVSNEPEYTFPKPIEAANDDVQLWPVLIIIGILIFIFGIFLVASQS